MKLVLLGTAGYHPSTARHTACVMLPEAGLVFDAGSAMFRVRDFLCTSELDIFLTHVHLDHSVGLTFLFDVLQGRDMDRVTIHARAKDIQAIDRHLLDPSLFPVKLPYEFRPLGTARILTGCGGVLTHFPLDHPGGAVGYRVDFPGRSIAYVSDTTASVDADYVSAIDGVDVLLHECNFDDSMTKWAETTGHSCVTAVAQVANAARVGRLVLVHLNPLGPRDDPIGVAAAKSIFEDTVVGFDLAQIDV